MKISQIRIYPVKSCGGISLPRCELSDRGLLHDRRWMVVDANGRFITQRTHHRLSLVRCELASDGFILSVVAGASEAIMRPLHLPISISIDSGAVLEVEVWRYRGEVVTHAEGGAWFTEFLGEPCSLVYMPDSVKRQINPAFGKAGEIISFADGYPLLLVSEASVTALNQRLQATGAEVTTFEAFRPNIVVSGAAPFDEDGWQTIRVGDVTMRHTKPCTRCVMINVDGSTGRAGVEPLRTLAALRKESGNVSFGINLVHENRGCVSVGDDVSVCS